jgi:peptide/nickel transport system permease protein
MTMQDTRHQSPFRELLSELTPTATGCVVVLCCFVFIVIFAPLIAPYGEGEILTNTSFALPGSEGDAKPGTTLRLGGDFLGRDILSRLIYGARVTLSVALAISLLAFFLGSAFGFLAAVLRGTMDAIMSRVVDALISFPSIMIALIVVTSLGSSFTVLIITVALIDATRVFRIARALGMDIVVQDYIEAAKVRGEGLGWIMWHELLPNALGPLSAEFGIRFTYAILFISALSFLGLGVQPPHADLGLMVKENLQAVLYASAYEEPLYMVILMAPAICIAIVTVSVNMLVDWFLKSTGASLPEEL